MLESTRFDLMVFGSINLDVSLRAPRLPAAGETLMGSGLHISPGGKGANQAHAARRFGASVAMVGAVGQDGFAQPALACLVASGVDMSAIRQLDAAQTGTATITVTGSGENAIVVAPGANDLLRAQWVSEDLVSACATLLLQMEVPVGESMALARRVKQAGGRVMLNLAPVRDLHLLDPTCLDWLIVNQSELAALYESLHLPVVDLAGRAASLATGWACTVVVTLGEAGAMACLPDGTRLDIAPLAVDVVDTTGAGDTFCGVLAAALAQGLEAAAALRTASVAASLACRHHGAQHAQASREEIEQAELAA